jgi:hypothetical protein
MRYARPHTPRKSKSSSESMKTSMPAVPEASVDVESPSVAELLLQQMECPVCFQTSTPPIMQCVEGHVLCLTCCAKLKAACPMCKAAVSCRNRALENMCEGQLFPCAHAAAGCTKLMPIDNLR